LFNVLFILIKKFVTENKLLAIHNDKSTAVGLKSALWGRLQIPLWNIRLAEPAVLAVQRSRGGVRLGWFRFGEHTPASCTTHRGQHIGGKRVSPPHPPTTLHPPAAPPSINLAAPCLLLFAPFSTKIVPWREEKIEDLSALCATLIFLASAQHAFARCACALRNILNVLCSVAKPLFAVTANDEGKGRDEEGKRIRNERGGGEADLARVLSLQICGWGQFHFNYRQWP
jgi:hypothetical protein